MRTKLVPVIAAVLLIVSGCAKKQGPAATPKEAVSKLFDGMLEFDKAKFLGSLAGDTQELKAAEAFIDYMIAVKDFKKSVIDKYGASGWAHFEKEGGAKLSLNMTNNKEMLDSMKVQVEGDKAVCSMPGEAQVMNLSRKNGVWYVNAKDVFTTGGMDLEQFIKVWSGMSNLIRKKQQRIGQPGVTAQSLDMELGNEMLPILTGSR